MSLVITQRSTHGHRTCSLRYGHITDSLSIHAGTTSSGTLPPPVMKTGDMEESMLLIKGGHLVWSRAAWSHGWSGWAMPLLIDINEDEVGEEGWGWGDLSTDVRMVHGDGG